MSDMLLPTLRACVGSSLCFQFLLPVIQISLICLCVGGDPKGIQVAVVNNETAPSAYSQSLLSFLDNSSVQQVFIWPLQIQILMMFIISNQRATKEFHQVFFFFFSFWQTSSFYYFCKWSKSLTKLKNSSGSTGRLMCKKIKQSYWICLKT